MDGCMRDRGGVDRFDFKVPLSTILFSLALDSLLLAAAGLLKIFFTVRTKIFYVSPKIFKFSLVI